MAIVQKIENEVARLDAEELAQFRAWFEQFDAAAWDAQFEEDVVAGRLDTLAQAALDDFRTGRAREL